jgi:hypothetical protein
VTACTERAVFVRDLDDAEMKGVSCDRLYIGSETCETLIPSPHDVARMQELGARLGRPVTVVTPACTNMGIASVKKLLAVVSPGTEVVFNDWGVFERIRSTDCRPVLGRLLLRIPRGFRRKDLADYAPGLLSFMRYSNLDDGDFQTFLIESGVHRVELDNVVQGYSFRLHDTLRTSLYVPLVYIASGRKCVFARLQSPVDTYKSGQACARTCRDTVFHARMRDSDDVVLLVRNAHYYLNDDLPARPEDWNTDRIVDCSHLVHVA